VLCALYTCWERRCSRHCGASEHPAVTNILGSDHLLIIFSVLDPVRTREARDPVEKPTDWELLQSLAYELIFQNIQIPSSNEADKAVRHFEVSAYRIQTRKTTILAGGTKYLA
jgi:hypothetical protein